MSKRLVPANEISFVIHLWLEDQERPAWRGRVTDADGKKSTYAIVGSAEAKPAEMKLSNESPVGKALVGHKRGETVTFATPKGERKLKITKIDVSS